MRLISLSLLNILLSFFHLQASNHLELTALASSASCVTGVFSASGDTHWQQVSLKLTNNCSTAIDLQNAIITFTNKSNLNTSFWCEFDPLSYPDNDLKITSQADSRGAFLSTLNLHFPTYAGANSKLSPGSSILIKYGYKSADFVQNSVNVNVGNPVSIGSINLINASVKPANISTDYALVTVSLSGKKITDVQLPWQNSKIVGNLAPGSYTLSAQNLTDSAGNIYQFTITPSTIVLAANQNIQANITYNKVQQEGKLAIQVQSLPAELAGYTGKLTAIITSQEGGSSVSTNLNWNALSTITQLKTGSNYTFSTPVINYKGINWTPLFTPATLTAKATTAPATVLTYQRAQVTENTGVINVKGAPSSLSSLDITLTPTNGTTAIIYTLIPLQNGIGSNSVLLSDGVTYTLSSGSVPGYSVNFSSQPLVSAPNVIETITLTPVAVGTPIAINGQLKVTGNQLCNEQGQTIQLRGMSTHGLQWFEDCLTLASLDTLADDFKANVIRISLYVQEDGYETDPVGFTAKVNQLIKAASDRGIYALIDWHILTPGDPNYNLDRAKKFFTDIATANKGRKNLIYEIANEPNGVNWNAIKSYAEKLIPVIRAIDPDTVILVGTVGWSSLGVSDGRTSKDIINAPVNFANVMYTFHFYAASHRDDYLNELDRASDSLPIFVTEFGTQTYSGDGANDFDMANRYLDLMARKNISWINWNYSDDFRSGAIWKTGTCPNGPWTDADLKPAGVYIKAKIKN